MRKYSESACSNLLKRPLVLGVPFFPMASHAFLTLGLFWILSTSQAGSGVVIGYGLFGYVGLRVASGLLKPGFEESILWWVLTTAKRYGLRSSKIREIAAQLKIELAYPLTMTELAQCLHKQGISASLRDLKASELKTISLNLSKDGDFLGDPSLLMARANPRIFTLYKLPSHTDPLFLFRLRASLPAQSSLVFSVRGLSQTHIRAQVKTARLSNASANTFGVRDLDAQVNFEETSSVLTDIFRGTEVLVEGTFLIVSPEPVELDPEFWCPEKNPELTLKGALGLWPRFHRGLLLRADTASDLVPSLCFPREAGLPILRHQDNTVLQFSPLDQRLEALHWLVAGASGSGKSFFTAVILKRLIEAGEKISVLFVDHNRSFRRVVKSVGGAYLEPQTFDDLVRGESTILTQLETPFSMCGIELSDLLLSEKKKATHYLLSAVQSFLKGRRSSHPVYFVFDECWNFMRDEPELVQRAFREFRKLNGAAVAITQSLSDFLTDESGQSIFQNAPVRILLRQGEDVEQYKGMLGLNSTEAKILTSLKQVKHQYSECLIKTPYMSRLARLCPTADEYALCRTDNLREEINSPITTEVACV